MSVGSWTTEQILALAPDAGSAKAGKELASPRKWLTLGQEGQAAWGECQGSGAHPYQTKIDLSEPAFQCTCPSRKFPCKHALGLFLLLEGFGRLETLPPDVQADIRGRIGWSLSQEELLAEPGVHDHWWVIGQRVEEEERLRVQRTWLWGRDSGRAALILQFAHSSQPLDVSLLPGTEVDADLVFYPGAYPLRALVKTRHASPAPLASMPGYDTAAAASAAYAAALARDPWLEALPLPLQAVVPLRHNGGWAARDAEGQWLPLSSRFARGWHLAALSGGHPLALFGEWDGRH